MGGLVSRFNTLLEYEIRDILSSRWFLFYIGSFNTIVYLLLYFANQTEQVYGSALNAVLYTHFIATLIFSTLKWQNSADFVALVLSQPVNRREVFWARLAAFMFCVGAIMGASLLLQLGRVLDAGQLVNLLLAQISIQAIATGMGFLIAIAVDDKLKAISIVGLWIMLFGFALDALSLTVMIQFSAFPLEKTILGLSLLNPLALLKYQGLMEQNSSLWLGYAGVLLTRAWKSGLLRMASTGALVLWVVLPALAGAFWFERKDL